MSRQQQLDRLAVRIKRGIRDGGIPPTSTDEALMMVEMGKQQVKLRGVLESFEADETRPTVTQIYQRFCGGLQ